jgi:hypothetical protein
MDTLIQASAAFGPVLLAIMGVVVSLNPPDRIGRAHKIWAWSFAIVGFLAALAIFFEFRGTDQILGQIWEHVREPKVAPHTEGRHLDADQKVRMKKALQLGPDENYEFQINSSPSCEECELFAEELREFFNTIPGWKTNGGPLLFQMPTQLRGLILFSLKETKTAEVTAKIKGAFSAAGMPLQSQADGVQSGSFVILVARPNL